MFWQVKSVRLKANILGDFRLRKLFPGVIQLFTSHSVSQAFLYSASLILALKYRSDFYKFVTISGVWARERDRERERERERERGRVKERGKKRER